MTADAQAAQEQMLEVLRGWVAAVARRREDAAEEGGRTDDRDAA